MPELERVLQNTPVTLSQQWYEAGVAVDPGTVTVAATRADGSALAGFGSATGGSGTNPRTVNLTAAHMALLDRFTVTWASTLKGTLVSYVEVVGGFHFTVAEGLAMFSENEVAGITAAEVAEKRVLVEQALEDACGVAFVPRYERETVSGGRVTGTDILLKWPRVRTVRAVSVAGTAFTAEELDTLSPWATGVYRSGGWTVGFHNIVVDYEHGHDFPPMRVSEAALLLLKNWMTQGPVDDRTTSFSTDSGTFALSTPGLRGIVFGLPEVDAVVNQYGQRRVFA